MVLRGRRCGRVGRRRTSSSMGDHFGGPPSTFLREDCKQCRKASVRTRTSRVPVPNDPAVPAAVPAQRTSAAAPVVAPPVPPAAGPLAAVADARPPAISAPDGRVSVRAASGPGAQLATPAVSARPRAAVPARAVAAEQIVIALPTGVPPAEGAPPAAGPPAPVVERSSGRGGSTSGWSGRPGGERSADRGPAGRGGSSGGWSAGSGGERSSGRGGSTSEWTRGTGGERSADRRSGGRGGSSGGWSADSGGERSADRRPAVGAVLLVGGRLVPVAIVRLIGDRAVAAVLLGVGWFRW